MGTAITLLAGGASAKLGDQNKAWISLSPSNSVPRSTIATWLSAASSSYLSTLALPVRLRVTGEVASMFERIRYPRKAAFVLRELAALCAEGVAKKGATVEATPEGQADASLSPVREEESPSACSAGTGSTVASSVHASIVRMTSDSAGNDSVVQIAEKVCEAFGVDVVPKSRDGKRQRQGSPQGHWFSSREHFGWPALQIGALKDSISIAEALPGECGPKVIVIVHLTWLSSKITKQLFVLLSLL
jgi:hypothetical protein